MTAWWRCQIVIKIQCSRDAFSQGCSSASTADNRFSDSTSNRARKSLAPAETRWSLETRNFPKRPEKIGETEKQTGRSSVEDLEDPTSEDLPCLAGPLRNRIHWHHNFRRGCRAALIWRCLTAKYYSITCLIKQFTLETSAQFLEGILTPLFGQGFSKDLPYDTALTPLRREKDKDFLTLYWIWYFVWFLHFLSYFIAARHGKIRINQ
jgi:hypothetical protein